MIFNSKSIDYQIEKLGMHKIGVLAGGSSSERDISLKSGTAVFNALSGLGLDVVLIDVNEDEFLYLIDEAGISAAFIALHGTFGEDGTIQKLLEGKGIPYTGSGPLASNYAMDKVTCKKIFKRDNLPWLVDLLRQRALSPTRASLLCV